MLWIVVHMAICSRCTCVAWVPDGDGIFVSAHADGNIYVYGKVSQNQHNFYLLLVFFSLI